MFWPPQEPIPTVESFLSILLEVWNGSDYQHEIFQLLTHLSFQPFEGLMTMIIQYSRVSYRILTWGHFEESYKYYRNLPKISPPSKICQPPFFKWSCCKGCFSLKSTPAHLCRSTCCYVKQEAPKKQHEGRHAPMRQCCSKGAFLSKVCPPRKYALSKVCPPIYAAVHVAPPKADIHHCCYCISKRVTKEALQNHCMHI